MGIRIYARVVAAGVFLLLIAGALVTSTESGLAVPDWPLSYGRLMPPMVGGIFYEHGHRLVAAAVSTLVGVQVAVLLLLGGASRLVKRLSLLAFGAILLQALLGGLTVIFLLPPAVSSAHSGLAQIVFALTAAIALLTSRAWTDGEPFAATSADAIALANASRAVVVATAVVYVQILLGAVVRHTGAGLAIPDYPLSFGRLLPAPASFAARGVPMAFAHRAFALVAAVLVARAALGLLRLGRVSKAFPRTGILWLALLLAQLLLGALSVWTKKAVAVTTAHLAVGALCWVTGVLLAVALDRARRAAGPAVAAAPSAPSRAADFLALTKPRITVFVVLTAFVGFALGVAGPLSSLDASLLLHTLLGTALVASGTSAFNQLLEIGVDRRMARTADRPLPAGRLGAGEAFVFALAVSVAGTLELYVFVNALTALLAAATLGSYVFVYTPLKKRSPLSLLVGAVPGALPPLGGFTAAHGSVAAPGLALFAILFLWQLPHFLAIGWRHRADYVRAGVKIASTVDPTGRRTARETLLYTLALLPVSLLPALLGFAGSLYAVVTFALSALFLVTGIRFARRTTDSAAQTLFLASIAWLPAVLVLLVVDRIAL